MSEKTMMLLNGEEETLTPESTENDNSADSSSGEETTDEESTEKTEEESTEKEDSTEEETEETEDSSKDDSNLAKNPRWQERESDWKNRFNEQEERHTKEMEKLRLDIDEKFTSKEAEETDSEVPSWWGGDEESWKQFQSWNNDQVISKAKELALKEIDSKSSAEQKAIDDATIYFNEEVDSIQSDSKLNPQKVKIDRNKLMKFVLDNDLVDSKGKWNYRAGWQLMQAGVKNVNNEKIEKKKKLASATTTKNQAETKKSDVTTTEDFRNPSNRPW